MRRKQHDEGVHGVIRHIFLARVADSVLSELVQEWATAINSLVDDIPEAISIQAGRRHPDSQAPYDIAVVAHFANMQDWAVYRDHPAHQAVKVRLTDKIVAPDSRATIQVDL
jgi:hypothetical protein